MLSGSSAMRRLSTSLPTEEVLASTSEACGGHFHHLLQRADFEREVDARDFVDRQRDAGPRRRP